MNAQQMQDFVGALIAAAAASTAAANAVANQNPPPPAAAVPFALLLAESNVNALDWFNNKAIMSLVSKFALIENTLKTFIE
jgi:hypothetical protein